jgi:phosphate transport system substrate-binding protein
VTKAAAGVSMPDDFRVSITNAPAPGRTRFPHSRWLLLYENPSDKAMSKAMVDFVTWAIGDGQKFATELGYASLPSRGHEGNERARED